MKPPALTAHHRKLELLAGRWHATETFTAPDRGDAPPPTAGQYDMRVAVNGFALVVDYLQTGADGRYLMHGVIRWDTAAGEYVLDWWDSLGGYGPALRGSWDGDTLVLEGPEPNSAGTTRFAWRVTGDRLDLSLALAPDGATWATVMTASYRRDDPAPA